MFMVSFIGGGWQLARHHGVENFSPALTGDLLLTRKARRATAVAHPLICLRLLICPDWCVFFGFHGLILNG